MAVNVAMYEVHKVQGALQRTSFDGMFCPIVLLNEIHWLENKQAINFEKFRNTKWTLWINICNVNGLLWFEFRLISIQILVDSWIHIWKSFIVYMYWWMCKRNVNHCYPIAIRLLCHQCKIRKSISVYTCTLSFSSSALSMGKIILYTTQLTTTPTVFMLPICLFGLALSLNTIA